MIRTPRTRLATFVLATLLAPIACGGEPAEEPAGEERVATPEPTETEPDGARPEGAAREGADRVSGQAIFNANCATCHGQDGRGGGPAAVGLEPPPADLTDGTWTTGDGSLAAIENTIENGSPGTAMIAWKGTLTDAQIDAVARYVQSLGGR